MRYLIESVKNNKGAALLEFAIVSMILLVMIMGIAEFGLIILDYNRLSASAFMAARDGASGDMTAGIINTAISASSGLNITSADVAMKVGTAGVGTPSTWSSLGDNGTTNNATTGQMIYVTVQCDHHLLTGFFHGGASTLRLTSSAITRRE